MAALSLLARRSRHVVCHPLTAGGGGDRRFSPLLQATASAASTTSMSSPSTSLSSSSFSAAAAGRGAAKGLPAEGLIQRRRGHTGRPIIVHKRGNDVIHDPWFNKSTAFQMPERDRLGLRGLLPPTVQSMRQQIEQFMETFRSLDNGQHALCNTEPLELEKWRYLNRLHDRNETLYYKVLMDNIKEFAPIIYTPTVGLVCQKYSSLFRRPRGMYFSAVDRGEFISMMHNWPAEEVDMIVVTDGSRILGLGDLGVQGIGIPVGKLDLYVAAAGINPQRVLPVMFDVGTNNQELRDNPLYLGLRQQRLEGEDYLSLIDEFMDAAFTRWPNVIVQFEDFQNKWAASLLQRYRRRFRCFNDDIQGTACVALSGVLNAIRAQGRPMSDLQHAKIVVLGAGSAGLGVVRMLRQAMAKFMPGDDSALRKAARNFWVLDKDGLLTEARHHASEDQRDFLRPTREAKEEGGLQEGASLLEVVTKVKPDVLLGLSGVGGLFTEEVLQAVRDSGVARPAIFPMSNPTPNSECSSEDVFRVVGSRAIFASGSPFPSVTCDDSKLGFSNQANNMYIFPGIGLGSLLSGARIITDGMLHEASKKLASCISDDDVRRGVLFPDTTRIRDITESVAAAVARKAAEENNAEGARGVSRQTLLEMTEEELLSFVKRSMWTPEYSPLIYDMEHRFHEVAQPKIAFKR